MPIPESHMKARLSVSYVSAVAARAGTQFKDWGGDEYGIDGEIQKVKQLANHSFTGTGWMLQCQLKATTTSEIRDDLVVYDMEVEAYNKWVEWEGPFKQLLILFCLPKNFEEWLNLDEEQFLMKRCCYWQIPTDPESFNHSTKTIYIPRTQLLTPEAILLLLERLKQGDFSNEYVISLPVS
jgi:hypothetical protein